MALTMAMAMAMTMALTMAERAMEPDGLRNFYTRLSSMGILDSHVQNRFGAIYKKIAT